MITAQKIYFVSEDEEVFEYAYLNAVGNVNVSGLISDTIKETKFAIPICSKKWLFAQDLDNVLIVVADNKEMLNIIKELLKKVYSLLKIGSLIGCITRVKFRRKRCYN